jgi:hypothetical protein
VSFPKLLNFLFAFAAFSVGAATAASVMDVQKEEAWVAKRRSYWAFRPVVRPPVPEVQDPRTKTAVDKFLLGAMRAKGITPSAPVERRQLIRRATLDLTGLPPVTSDIDNFLNDKSPDAFEKVVDRLLASPAYAERWATRWLDVVRYADTNGFEADSFRPHAWRYRDYVIKSFQEDKPYNRFVQEQLAGDELWPGNQEALVASGFNRLGPIHIVGGVQDEELNRQERLTEMAGIIGPVFLGMTVGCARCHNHKFDPILQSDYYRLQAIFAGTEFKDIPTATPAEKTAYAQALNDYKAKLKPLKDQIEEIEKPYREKLRAAKLAKIDPPSLRDVLAIPEAKRTDEEKKLAKSAEAQIAVRWDEVIAALPPDVLQKRSAIREKLVALQDTEPEVLPGIFGVENSKNTPPSTHILQVGDYKHKMAEVQPGFLKVLAPDYGVVPQEAAGRRSALANWLASPEHPLSARVMVNRIWQFRMGTGIVGTPNDFGSLGQRPTNQALLDWLAAEFVANNWSVKSIDRLLVLSSAYQQSTATNAANVKIDPDNKLYWRMNRRRLEGEAIRDSVLASAGTINLRVGGKPVLAPIEKEVYALIFTEGEPDNLWRLTPDPSEYNRRSLYLLNKRSVRLPLLANFDQPDTMSSCAMRSTSTHALQSLSLFNSDFMQEQSEAFAARLIKEVGKDPVRQIERAFLLSLGRPPAPEESSLASAFLKTAPLSDFCLTLLNRNEFVYVP